MSRDRLLKTQGKLMASWPGTPLDRLGVLRILNEKGTRPPLLWIFNSASEPRKLAEALGPDQPLVISRSTHLLIDPADDPLPYRTQIGDYLVDELSRNFPGQRFDAGANCQGAFMIMYLCTKSDAATFDIDHLCLINSSLPDMRTGRPALLVYGREDPGHDPFRKNRRDAAARAARSHSTYRRMQVNAKHGSYFDAPNLAKILRRFQRLRSGHSAPWKGALLQALQRWAGTSRPKGAA